MLFPNVYKQEYGMVEVLKTEIVSLRYTYNRVVYLRRCYVLNTRYVVFLACWVNVVHVDVD